MKKIKVENCKVYINHSTFNLIESFKQIHKTANEAGGILFGQIKENDIYILRASTPNKYDKSKRYSFECNKDAAQILIDYEFYNSGQKTIYLGEWHTHPDSIPTPSTIDRKMITDQFIKNKLNESLLILIIQGLNGLFTSIYNGKCLEQIKFTLLD